MLAEIERLKHSQERTGAGSGNALEKEVTQLRQKLHETQNTLASSTRYLFYFPHFSLTFSKNTKESYS